MTEPPAKVAAKPLAAPLPKRRTSLLALDLSLGWTFFVYLLVVIGVGRYTLFSWVDLDTLKPDGAGALDPLLHDGGVRLIALLAAIFIHLLPWQAYRKARRLDRELVSEARVASRILTRAQELVETRSAELDRKGIDSLRTQYFSTDIVSKDEIKTGAYRIAQDVLRRVQTLRFEPTAALVRPYREALQSRLPEIVKYQRIALQLGIMSTFFGLMMVFSRAEFASSVSGGGNATAMASSLIGGLNLAFGGSVAGLISSVAVILFLDHLRKELTLVAQLHEQEAEQLTVVAHIAFNDPALRDNLAALESALTRTEGELQGVRRDLMTTNTATLQTTAALEKSHPKVVEAVESLGTSLAALATQQQNVAAAMATQQQNVAAAITESYKKFTPDQLGKQIVEALSGGLAETDRQLRATAQTISEFRDAVREISEANRLSHMVSLDLRNSLARMERTLRRNRRDGVSEAGPLPFGLKRFWQRAKVPPRWPSPSDE